MKQITFSCLETKSISTHCLMITDENTFEKWIEDVLFYNEYEDKFISKKEFLKVVKNKFSDIEMKNLEELINTYETKTEKGNVYEAYDVFYSTNTFPYEFWNDEKNYYLEHVHTAYTTPEGEKLAIHCWYGYER